MKKKLGEILLVSNVFNVLAQKHYRNFSLSYKIAKALKELEEQKEFYSNEERKIVETYAVKDEKGQVKIIDGNRISFKNQEDAIQFNKEINELQNTEVDIFEPIVIGLSDFKDGEMILTPQEINSLDGFVEFVSPNNSSSEVIN